MTSKYLHAFLFCIRLLKLFTFCQLVSTFSIWRVEYVCWPQLKVRVIFHLMTNHGGSENISRVFNNSRSDLYFHNSEIRQTILDPCCHIRICWSQSAHQGVIWFLVSKSNQDNNWNLAHFRNYFSQSDSLSTKKHIHRFELWPDDDWEHYFDW